MISFPVDNFNDFKIQMLNWANQFNIFCLLDNQQYNFNTPEFECLLAAGCKSNIQMPAGNAFEELATFYSSNNNEWLFGHFGYDLKNEIENLQSSKPDFCGFADLHFFVPQIIITLNNNNVTIHCDYDAQRIFDDIINCPTAVKKEKTNPINIQQRIAKDDYVQTINHLRAHIERGDCYEINFCQEFYAEEVVLDPQSIYHNLITVSPNPFSALYKVNDSYCLCASPERYIKKEGKKILSQPIKGTSKRYTNDAGADELSKNYLLQSAKEKSENIMVVDLVRNDLSRICKAGTVKVDELFGLYSFPQVHQMISTISGEINDELSWIDCIKATFPMGSMTGAPKKRVMQLIEKYEKSRRGLFSGAIGYVKPGGQNQTPDFDFNVVIRSIMYNKVKKYLSFQTGGGITYNSLAEQEYEECLLKAGAMMKVLELS